MPAKKKTSAARKLSTTKVAKKPTIQAKKTTLRKASNTPAKKPTATLKLAAPKKAQQITKITPEWIRAHAPKVKEAYTKSQLLTNIAELCQLQKRDVTNVLEALQCIAKSHLCKSGPAVFKLPGLIKLTVIEKPAQKARQGINPFTGEPTTFKAKPARKVVKARVLKEAKEFAN